MTPAQISEFPSSIEIEKIQFLRGKRQELMPDDIQQLKDDVRKILEQVSDVRQSVAIAAERSVSLSDSIHRAHDRIDELELELKELRTIQNKNSWIPLVATAALMATIGGWVSSLVGA